MKIADLYEMPTLRSENLPVDDLGVEKFISAQTIIDTYDMVWRSGPHIGAFCLLIDKDRLFAVYGYFSADPHRSEVDGVSVVSIVDFKDGYDIGIPVSWDHNKILQVDLVRTASRHRRMGIGTDVYIKLAQSGFAVVSDTEQWNGGKHLWKKIAASTSGQDVSVHVIHRGHNIGTYNGINFTDEQLWSETGEHKHTLFLLKRN